MSNRTMRRTYWVAAAFYLLIVIEFIYMASPFAFYFYSVYKPTLSFLYSTPALAWLPRFFLPHLAMQTKSPLIDHHNVAGAFLSVLGLLGFLYSAIHVYYSKLAKKGAVTGGAYTFVRHPQYTSLIVCGFGLLLHWPRYIVLVFFITMVFAYYMLARIEEKECEYKFGRLYRDYMEKTGMFFPVLLGFKYKQLPRPSSKKARFAVYLLIYFLVMSLGIGVAKLLENHSRHSLYTYYAEGAVNVSLVEIDDLQMQELVLAALNEPSVKSLQSEQKPGEWLLNYILPSNIFMSEIPMHGAEGSTSEHFMHAGGDTTIYKIIITKAILVNGKADNEQVLKQVTGRIPITEIWLNSADNTILQVYDPPAKIEYEGIPMPIF